MQRAQPSVFARSDTFFGICEAIGEDLRFNPNILRVALALPLLWATVPVLVVYVSLGAVVALSRLLWPNPRLAAEAPVETGKDARTEPQPVAQPEPLAIAA
ncbi:MAG: hypothetical protein AVDCRST_MAG23-2095 [uncultured Sphingosinicella sp.]|uniref:Phage shock protein PspC N-terminal domain-containing protein n=1 Tax=uncultured Sphingosinicella sp. TaxID=478748 RepID=A0A6J4U629_9SPHN|nr:PspC domain-containing protein [uncultured Sphingosinicella sp.]CAA9541390.1 MAG: hypothetical protein AVDCRST_MAG23-2095 [uncultured Sphingosinicella sp.]